MQINNITEILYNSTVLHIKHLMSKLYSKLLLFGLFVFLDPVILDPNSKTTHLAVSSNLTSILYSGPVLLNSPEKHFCSILGSEGFSSGVHIWQVHLEACEHWALGVVPESAKKNAKFIQLFILHILY